MKNIFSFKSWRRILIAAAMASSVITTGKTASLTPATVGGIDWQFTDVEDTNGDWWKSFIIDSVPGVKYTIEKSDDLDVWVSVKTYYGNGYPIYHPLFPGSEPTAAPTYTAPINATPSPTMKVVPVVLEHNSSREAILSWESLSGAGPIRYSLSGVILDDIWDEYVGGYIDSYGDYMFLLSPRVFVDSLDPSPQPTLSVADQVFVTAFTSALPGLTVKIENSVAATAESGPLPPPDPNAKKFFRIRANWELDSDGDGRYNWQELALDNTNPYNADSNGDGISDGAQVSPPIVISSPAPLDRPPTATIQHRWTKGFRTEQYLGSSATITYGASRSDEFVWASDSPEMTALSSTSTFSLFSSSVESLASSSTWSNGVVSLESKNKEDHDSLGNLSTKEWINFDCDYRIKLSAAAPEGGYEIPLTFGKVYYQWNDTTNVWEPTAPVSGETSTFTLTLTVPEGQTESSAIAVPSITPGGVNRAVTIVPADIAIREGNGNFPIDGLCVQVGEAFKLDFNGDYQDASATLMDDNWITWQSRRLNADGSFEDWDTFTISVLLGATKGAEVTVGRNYFGCLQLRAVLTAPNQPVIYFPVVRMRDSTNAVNSLDTKNPILVAGQPEYVGVANCALSELVRDKAVSWLGSTQYRLNANVEIKPGYLLNPNTVGSNKCNIFITHVSNSVGATTPYFFRDGIKPTAPIARLDWHSEPEQNIDLDAYGWKNVGLDGIPAPGRVVANFGLGDSGHCGILDYDGAWISAGPATVNKFIHPSNAEAKYKPFRIRTRE